MDLLTLYLGNKNYSTWSMRAWLAARRVGVPFEEHVFDLTSPGVRDEILRHSPAGKVPALRHGDLRLWDSLAISEYLAERFPEAGLWPEDTAARATARAICAEMHSGFPEIRNRMPMNIRRSSPGVGMTPAVQAEIERILAIWRECRTRFGQGGPFLFGSWSIADCMFAPVVSRLRTYAVAIEDEVAAAYMDSVWNWQDVRDWSEAARVEPMSNPAYDL